jgi:hypothetical protein
MGEIDPLNPAQPTRGVENRSGGVELEAERDIVVAGDVVGRDKIIVGYTVEQVSLLLDRIAATFQPREFDGRCPYLGLDAFTEDDADRFFGREAVVEQLVGRVKESRFVVIAGPSGTGKSSLVQAGLIHALKQDALPDVHSERWLYITFTPQRDPIEQLALAVSRLAPSPEAGDYVRRHAAEPNALHICAEALLSDRRDRRLVILVDQFEEVFTQVAEEDKRAAFLNLITHAATTENGRVIVLFVLRSDFLSHCAAYAPLNALINQQFIQIGAMQPAELVSAVARPALQVGLRIEPDLVAQIVSDMRDEPGMLPLLQFALKDLFDARQVPGSATALTLDNYFARGGLHKSLERHADAAFGKLSDEEQQLARAIFSGLIEIGRGTPDTRRAAALEELLPLAMAVAPAEAVVQKLADARLLSTDEQAGRNSITISHEKLIEAWPWLRKLVDENRAAIALQNQIAEDAQEWNDQRRDASYLYGGVRLANAREQLAAQKIVLSALAQDFVEAGIRAEKDELEETKRRNAQLRRSAMYLVGALGVALVLGVLAAMFGVQSNDLAARNASIAATAQAEADRAAKAEGLSRVRELAARGQARFEDQPLLGIRLALEAWASMPSDNDDIRAAIENEIQQLAATGRVLNLGRDLRQVYASADGAWLILNRALAADEVRRTSNDPLNAVIRDGVANVYFSPHPDAATFVVAYDNSTGEIRRTTDASPIAELTGTIESVIFSPAPLTSTFVIDYADAAGELRRNTEGLLVAPLAGKVVSVTFSSAPTATYVVVDYDGAPGELRRTADGQRIKALADEIVSVKFSPDPAATYFLVQYDRAPAEVRRSADGLPSATFTRKVDNVYFNPTAPAPYFVVDYLGAPGELQSSVDDSVLETLAGEVVRVLFSPATDARYFIVYYKDAPGEVRRVADGKLSETLPGVVRFAKSSSDLARRYFEVEYLAAEIPDVVRRATDGSPVVTFADKVAEIDFSPDASSMIVDYLTARDEIIRTADGARLATLGNEVVNVKFDPQVGYVVLDYDKALGEVRRTTDGALVSMLTGEIDKMDFSKDGNYLVVIYHDGRTEVWDMHQAPQRLVDLGLGRAEYAIDLRSQRLMVRYSDSRAYLVDLEWLRAMGGDPVALPIGDLVRLICQESLTRESIAETDLKSVLGNRPALACR